MQSKIVQLIIGFLGFLPAISFAAGTYPIHAEWTAYTAPSGYTVTGFNLYQQGSRVCQVQGASATSLDCSVTLAADSANFTLTSAFSDGSESPHSSAFAYAAPVQTPEQLTAVITTSTQSGTAPLAVTLKAGSSSSTVSGYLWEFGDGTTATTSSTSHTYVSAGSYQVKLTITGSQGQTATATSTITVAPVVVTNGVHIEAGELAVTSQWTRVSFGSAFTSPIVVVNPPSYANSEPCVVRIRNVNQSGFDIRLYEWNYLDGVHPAETVNYLVLEKGRTTLPDGSQVEAGSFTGTTTFQDIMFTKAFTKTPVMLATVASVNESDTVSGRLQSIRSAGFCYYLREQERNANTHANEVIHYVAWEPGKGTLGSLQYEVGTVGTQVTNKWFKKTYQRTYAEAPMTLADIQTTNNTDPSALRLINASSSFQVKVEEEKSADTEVTHPNETVGYMTFYQVN